MADAKVITLFNHKGGVSKTTTTFHIGWKLASMGKRVLIVDADPQCNLTGLALGLEDYDSLFAFYDSKKNTDIYASLAPLFYDSNVQAITSNEIHVAKTKQDNLFLLAGNINFSKIDVLLATALTSSQTLTMLRPLIGSITHLIRTVSRQQKFDFVLIDTSPSVSATNKCIMMGSDYFIIPTSPDFYCYQAIDSLSEVFPQWVKDMKPFAKSTDLFALPDTPPKMLGFISQNYRVYTTEKNKTDNNQKTMSSAYQEWLDKIKKITADKLVPVLEKENMIVSKEVFASAVSFDKPYHLAGIQDFNTLIPVSQRLSKPIFTLTQEDGKWAGAVWETGSDDKKSGVKLNIEEADTVYTNMAQSIIAMVAA